MEENTCREGLLHHRTRLIGTPCRFTSGMEQEINRDIRPCDGTPELIEQGESVLLSEPAIGCRDQQVDVGIGPCISPGPGAKEAHLRSRDELANGCGHRLLQQVIGGWGDHVCTL